MTQNHNTPDAHRILKEAMFKMIGSVQNPVENPVTEGARYSLSVSDETAAVLTLTFVDREPSTTDTSRVAVELFIQRCWLTDPEPDRTETMLRALLAERDAAILREKSLKDSTEELRQLQREFNSAAEKYSNLADRYAARCDELISAKAERDTLRDQLAAARNEALEEARRKVESLWAHRTCREVCDHIEALKSTTPAPREVTPQEEGE